MNKKYSVFYSWQSDLDTHTNQNGIRVEIGGAINKIESKQNDISIEKDEATRNISGSPNITESIFNKIKNCDIFICDITTINSIQIIGKKTPNPNVLIELGYAIGFLGWERIIMLFNKSKGSFPDEVPFDINKHRITSYSIKDKADSNGKGELRNKLFEAIDLILKNNPSKPLNNIKKEKSEIQRDRDIYNLEWIMNQIHIPTMDDFMVSHPDMIESKVFHYWEGFSAVYNSKLFIIYNKALKALIDEFFNLLRYSLSFGHHYRSPPNLKASLYGLSELNSPRLEEEQDLILLRKNKSALYGTYEKLIAFINTNYLEIDLKNTNQKAFNEYLSYQDEY